MAEVSDYVGPSDYVRLTVAGRSVTSQLLTVAGSDHRGGFAVGNQCWSTALRRLTALATLGWSWTSTGDRCVGAACGILCQTYYFSIVQQHITIHNTTITDLLLYIINILDDYPYHEALTNWPGCSTMFLPGIMSQRRHFGPNLRTQRLHLWNLSAETVRPKIWIPNKYAKYPLVIQFDNRK